MTESNDLKFSPRVYYLYMGEEAAVSNSTPVAHAVLKVDMLRKNRGQEDDYLGYGD